VAGMSDLLRRTLGETIQVETVLAGGLWPTLADTNQLENAFLNLAVNARDAMPDGGKLTIETANSHLDDAYARLHDEVQPGQYVGIFITDTGIGMSAETVAQAFEPFFTTKDIGQGTGLGLSQVYGFIKQSGGHVKIYSEVGEGTTVKLYLPRYRGPETAHDGDDKTRELPRGRAETVLVVEDDPDVRDYSIEMITDLGYTVLSAGDGASALRLLDSHREVSLLFTDVGLPGGMNGRQLAEQALRRLPRLKVLYTTGYARNAIVHQGRLDSGVEVIFKPFTYSDLAAKIRQVLDD
jgi:CheY-like chemotaxis protein